MRKIKKKLNRFQQILTLHAALSLLLCVAGALGMLVAYL